MEKLRLCSLCSNSTFEAATVSRNKFRREEMWRRIDEEQERKDAVEAEIEERCEASKNPIYMCKAHIGEELSAPPQVSMLYQQQQ